MYVWVEWEKEREEARERESEGEWGKERERERERESERVEDGWAYIHTETNVRICGETFSTFLLHSLLSQDW